MPITYSPEITDFIAEEMATGTYADESALMAEALEVFRELKQRHGELRQQIQQSLEDEKAGRIAPFDVNEIVRELELELDEAGQPIL